MQGFVKLFELVDHQLDQIDQVLAEHYGLSEGEVNYLVNYDAKYRVNHKAIG